MNNKYESKVYGKGYALKVTPEDRAADVLHYLTTGHLLCDRSLEGVTWEEVELSDEARNKRTAALATSMKETRRIVEENLPSKG